MKTTRRTLVRGTAWTVPTALVAATAPAFAGTTGCVAPDLTPKVNVDLTEEPQSFVEWQMMMGGGPDWALTPPEGPWTSNWTYQPPATADGSIRWPGWVYESFRSNADPRQAVEISPSTWFEAVEGVTYTFSFPVRGAWGHGIEIAGAAHQSLEVLVDNDVLIYAASTRGGAHGDRPAGWGWLDTTEAVVSDDGTAVALEPVWVSVPYTATRTGRVNFRYMMRMPVATALPGLEPRNDGLMVGMPVLTCG